MKILTLISFILFLNFQASANLKIDQVCELFNQVESRNYQDFFSDDFLNHISNLEMDKILNDLIAEQGECLLTDPISKYFPMVSENWFYLHFKNGRSGLFKIQLNEDRTKISGFRYVGTTLHPQKIIFKEAMMKARDGVHLRTHIFLTSSRTKKETIMARTPYFFVKNEYSIGTLIQASYYIENGYHFVYQAIRGTGGSEGEALLFNPIEASDGADLVRWIRRQSFSNGKIAAVGTSYEGLTAIASGIENPKGLKLIISGAGPVDASSGTFNINGLLNLNALDYFNYFTSGKGIPFTGQVLSQNLTLLASKNLNILQYDDLLFNQNILEWDRWANAWINNDQNFWQTRTLLPYLKNIKAPVILTAGMKLDGNMPDAINNYLKLKPSNDHRLVIGFWDHGNNTPYNDGSNMSPLIAERFFKWLEHYLKGNPQLQILNEKPILIQSHFSNEPIQLSKLSDLNIEQKVFSLSSASLTETAKYVYEPLEDHPQSLNYIWEADEEWAILGNIELSIYYQINTPSSQIIFSLSKMNLQGQEEFVTTCVYGGRFEGSSAPLIYKNNYCPVFNKFAKGEKLILTISSNAFPTLARPSNTQAIDEVKTAEIQIFHSEKMPSQITLPLQKSNSILSY